MQTPTRRNTQILSKKKNPPRSMKISTRKKYIERSNYNKLHHNYPSIPPPFSNPIPNHNSPNYNSNPLPPWALPTTEDSSRVPP